MVPFFQFGTMSKDLVMLMVCNGMTAPALVEAVGDLKSSSKGAGTHKRREFYWKCYGDVMTYLSGKDEKLYGCITYQAEDEDNDDAGVTWDKAAKKEFKALKAKKGEDGGLSKKEKTRFAALKKAKAAQASE